MNLQIDYKNKLHKAGDLVVKTLITSGFEAYWVGGTVRDLVLGQEGDNLDIATNAVPEEVEHLLMAKGVRTKPVGKKFGTILAVIDGALVEITTYRAEGRYSDNRHPDSVTFIADASQDALRRDFTINSLYFSPLNGTLLDPVDGLKDIKRRLIRFVGNPKHRIDEDPLRMIRAARFAAQLGFKLEKNTFAAIKTRAKLLQRVSGERLKLEFDKILLSKNKTLGLRLLDELGLMRFLIPNLHLLKKIQHNSKEYHLEKDAFEHTLMVIENTNSTLNALYASLFHDLGKIDTQKKSVADGRTIFRFHGHQNVSAKYFMEFAERLRFPTKSKKRIEWLIIHHDDRTGFKQAKLINQIKHALEPGFSELLEVWKGDALGNLRLMPDGTKQGKLSEAYVIGLQILNKLTQKKDLIKKLASGEMILKYTKTKPGPQIKSMQLKITEQIYLKKIKSETNLKKYLQQNKKVLDNVS
jgi:tRNA nucleotidyltransferase (CCA-adding enzyme)